MSDRLFRPTHEDKQKDEDEDLLLPPPGKRTNTEHQYRVSKPRGTPGSPKGEHEESEGQEHAHHEHAHHEHDHAHGHPTHNEHVDTPTEADILAAIEDEAEDQPAAASPEGEGHAHAHHVVGEADTIEDPGPAFELLHAGVTTQAPPTFPADYGLVGFLPVTPANVPSLDIEADTNVTSPENGAFRAKLNPIMNPPPRLTIGSAYAIGPGMKMVDPSAAQSAGLGPASVTKNGVRWTCSYWVDVSSAVSTLVHQAEQEHIDDLERAYDVVVNPILAAVREVSGEFTGAPTVFWSDTFEGAKAKVQAAVVEKLPSTIGAPSRWESVLRITAALSKTRDDNRWHTVKTRWSKTPKETNASAKVLKFVGVPRSTIQLVPSSEVVKL